MEAKALSDSHAVLAKAHELLPDEFAVKLLAALAELEDNEAHRHHRFPVTHLHAVEGVRGVYRAYIDKISGWRLHVQYGDDRCLHLCDVLTPDEHDRAQFVIRDRRWRYDL